MRRCSRSGRLGLARIGLEDGAVVWQRDEAEVCANFVAIPERDTFYCGDIFGRLAERDMSTGVVIRNLDAQNGNSGALQSARGGTELVSFSLNEPVVARWRLDGSGPITRLVAPGWDVVDINETGEYVIVDRGDPAYDSQVVDTSTGETVHDLDGLLTTAWLDADTVGGAMRLDGFVELGHVDLDGGSAVSDNFNLDPIPVDAITDAGKEVPLLQYDDGEQVTIAPLDMETRSVGTPIEIGPSIGLTISRTGHRIGVGTDSGALLFDGDTGEQVAELPGDDDKGVFITVADQLFASTYGGDVTQYDLESLEPIRTFGGSRGYVQRIHGSADGSLVVTGGGDRAVTLFDVATGTRLGTPIQLDADEWNDFALSLDGRILAIGGGVATRGRADLGSRSRRGGRWPRARSPAAISREKSGKPTSAISRRTAQRARSFRSKPDERSGAAHGHHRRDLATRARNSPTSCATSAGFSYGRMCDAPGTTAS